MDSKKQQRLAQKAYRDAHPCNCCQEEAPPAPPTKDIDKMTISEKIAAWKYWQYHKQALYDSIKK